jgi:tRNA A37 threonylcarbamoyladenosine dehydratase
MADFGDRFGGVARVVGEAALARLPVAHVAVVGLGGVGSWAVEALARTGVGEFTLIDLDDICVTNVNRQLPALTSTLGQPKAAVLAARVRDINPQARVHPRLEFFTEATAPQLLAPEFQLVLDAIDSPSLKARLIGACRERGLPIITVGGAGGRRDPTRVRVADLAATCRDPLLAQVRSLLRKHHGFPRGSQPFGVDAVFSTEPLHYPETPVGCGGVPEDPPETTARGAACERRYGAVSFVTGAFGFAAAAQAVALIAGLPGLGLPPGAGRRDG